MNDIPDKYKKAVITSGDVKKRKDMLKLIIL
jgi:hypothetical protein